MKVLYAEMYTVISSQYTVMIMKYINLKYKPDILPGAFHSLAHLFKYQTHFYDSEHLAGLIIEYKVGSHPITFVTLSFAILFSSTILAERTSGTAQI